MQVTITLTESALLIFFCNLGLKNYWHGRPEIEPTTLDLSSQSGAYDLAATATPLYTPFIFHLKKVVQERKSEEDKQAYDLYILNLE